MKQRVLFVDDEQHALDSFRSLLRGKRKHWEMHFLADPREALKLLEELEFDAVVSDMRMPDVDGAQLLERAQELQPGAVRIILSGYSESRSVMRTARPAHQFLAKPCDGRTIIAALERCFRLREILTNEGVRKAITSLDSLPALPRIHEQLLQELNNPEPSLARVANLVQQDPAISASLLKLVNSAFFGLFERVETPSRAVMLLVTETLKGLMLGIHLLALFDSEECRGFDFSNLWAHSLRTAAFAKVIAAMESDSQEFIDVCNIAGLLHDVGKLVLVRSGRESYRNVLPDVHQNNRLLYQAEYEHLGLSHAEAGAYLLGLWNASERVVFAVYNHHLVRRSETDTLDAATCLHVANCLEHELVTLHEGRAAPPLDFEHLERLGLLERVEDWKERCKELLDSEEIQNPFR